MKAFYVYLLAIGFFLIQSAAHAQYAQSISGRIVNRAGGPLKGINVNLYNGIDSLMISSVITTDNGEYLFSNVRKSSYRIKISGIGYKPKIVMLKVDSLPLVLPSTVLDDLDIALAEVRITTRKALTEQKIDRTVVNVDAVLSATGGNALDVLQKSPGVMVGQNGSISLNGKVASIFIDGKPTYLSGSDLENYLLGLPASVLDQLELMTNPPSKYDAAGGGGVINIRTKRNRMTGVSGGGNFSYIQGNYGRINSSANINYRSGKINISANAGYVTTNSYGDLDINRRFVNEDGTPGSDFLQNSFIRYTGKSANLNLNLDYYLTEKSTLGINVTGLTRPNEQHSIVRSQFLNPTGQLDSVIGANNKEKGKFKNGGVNLNYRHEFDKEGKMLTFDLDYLNYVTDKDQRFASNTNLPSGIPLGVQFMNGTLPTKIDIYSIKGDYAHPLKDGLKLEAGFKVNFTLTDNEANYFNTIRGVSIPDYDKTNHFNYKENINSIYLNANKVYRNLTLQLGLRLENTFSKGHQLGNVQKPDSTFNNNYTSVFPTVYVQYKLDTTGNHLIGLNYGRRIDRPYFQDLNPFVSPIDKFTYYTGNPYLKPSYANKIELSHTYKNRLTTTLSYARTEDQVNETIEINDGIYYSRPGNIGKSIVKAISMSGSLDLTNWLTVNMFAQVANIHTKGRFYTGYIDTEGTFLYLKPLVQIRAEKDWLFQIDGYYQSKVTNVQFVAGAQKRINAAISKKIFDSTTIKLVVNDIFHSYVNSGVINNLVNTAASYRNIVDSRTAVLTVSYRFTKGSAKAKTHDRSSTDSEQNRVKY